MFTIYSDITSTNFYFEFWLLLIEESFLEKAKDGTC